MNNTIITDNRIPPYGMDYEEASKRNVLPVPSSQYGSGSSGTYNYWDELILNPPAGATYATIDLLYQPTSWEYVQFLLLANNKQNAFLAEEGENLFNAWFSTGMAEPYVMTSATWGNIPTQLVDIEQLKTGILITEGKGKNATEVFNESNLFSAGDAVIIRGVITSSDISLSGSVVTVIINESIELSATSDSEGNFEVVWETSASNKQGQGGTEPGDYTAIVTSVTSSEGSNLEVNTDTNSVSFTIQ